MTTTVTTALRKLLTRIANGPTCTDCGSTLGSIGYSSKFCWVCTGLLPAPKGKEALLADKAADLRAQADAIEQQLAASRTAH